MPVKKTRYNSVKASPSLDQARVGSGFKATTSTTTTSASAVIGRGAMAGAKAVGVVDIDFIGYAGPLGRLSHLPRHKGPINNFPAPISLSLSLSLSYFTPFHSNLLHFLLSLFLSLSLLLSLSLTHTHSALFVSRYQFDCARRWRRGAGALEMTPPPRRNSVKKKKLGKTRSRSFGRSSRRGVSFFLPFDSIRNGDFFFQRRSVSISSALIGCRLSIA